MAMLVDQQKETFLSRTHGHLDQYAPTIKKELLAAQAGHNPYPWFFYADRSRRSFQMKYL